MTFAVQLQYESKNLNMRNRRRMHVGRDCIRANAHNRGGGVLMRQQADNGARRNTLLDSPAHAEYNSDRHVFAQFNRNGSVQVARRAKERRLVFADIHSDAVIGLTKPRQAKQQCEVT